MCAADTPPTEVRNTPRKTPDEKENQSKDDDDPRISSMVSELDAQIRKCTLCRLHENRTKAVPGSGRIQGLEIMFVGEGPGRNEDEAGEPFVGAGGKILSSVLKEAGLERSDVYITNIVKCRPPQNRKPKDDEVEICTKNYLEKQVELLKPKLICTLGATALEYFTGEVSMGKNHGKLVRSRDGHLYIFPTYHPAAILRNESFKAVLQEDIKKIPGLLKSLEQRKKEEREVVEGRKRKGQRRSSSEEDDDRQQQEITKFFDSSATSS